ncbi:MAG: ABC transporter permease [Acidobacteria bacterium]|nr:ABC transporter permease [Acidobacteriota bacterium]
MRFELFIASRYLRAKRRQAVIGVITAISVVGVGAGVASLVIALAITNGFRQDLQDRLLAATANVQLERVAGDGIGNYAALTDRLEREPHVIAAAPAMYEQVMISKGARASVGLLKGILPKYERRVSELLADVKQGSAGELEPNAAAAPATEPAGYPSYPPIVLGKDLAAALGATVGELVLVSSPQGEITPFGLVPKYQRFRVAGILQTGFFDYDNAWALIRLSDAQKLESEPDIASVIEFRIDDIYRAREIGRELERAAGAGFQTTNWMEQNRALFRALRLERVVTFITIALIVLVAALNILISLIMMVMEKTRDIAVLMSLGARRRQVQRIFIAQGVLIGITGTLIGLVAGYVLAWAGGHYHWISLSPEVYSLDYVPFAPRVGDGALVAAVAIGVSLIATIYPSRSASRIFPAEALRYE